MSNFIKLNNLKVDTEFHLYLATGCPFCHRVLAAIYATGLKDKFTITWMKNVKPASGWQIETSEEPLFKASSLDELYTRLGATTEQRRSVPIMVDNKNKVILSTESTEIVRFISFGLNGLYYINNELAPVEHIDEINKKNAWLHEKINRAVYLVGFSTETIDYQHKLTSLFQALDEIEDHLTSNCYLVGTKLTESDLFLLATLDRFDSVYFNLFRCNLRKVSDYPNLLKYHNRIKSMASLYKTYDQQLTIEHYYLSTMHVRGEGRDLNPSKTIPNKLAINA